MIKRLLPILALMLIWGCDKDSSPVQVQESTQLANTGQGPSGDVQYESQMVGMKGNNASMAVLDYTPSFAIISDYEEVFRVRGFAGSAVLTLKARDGSAADIFPGSVNLNGTQVLGPRQPGIPDATSPEDAVRAINALLEVCREHGLIDEVNAALAAN